MDQPPGVTFIMPARNAEATVESAIRSALGQTYAGDVKLIAVDDGSLDSTPDLIAGFGDRVQFIRLAASVGRAAARNIAIDRVRTPLVALHDADDVSLPDRLSTTVPLVTNDWTIAGGQVAWISESGVWREGGWPIEPEAIRSTFVGGHMAVAHPTVVMTMRLMTALRGYDPALAYAEDLELMLRAMTQHDARFAATPRTTVKYLRPPIDSIRYIYATEKWRRRVVRRYGLAVVQTSMTLALGASLRASARQRAAAFGRKWL
jgi:glycosyltransferase involved in cell wall biosynthesis